MPVDLDIEVESMALDEHDIEQLRMDTWSVLHLCTSHAPTFDLHKSSNPKPIVHHGFVPQL